MPRLHCPYYCTVDCLAQGQLGFVIWTWQLKNSECELSLPRRVGARDGFALQHSKPMVGSISNFSLDQVDGGIGEEAETCLVLGICTGYLISIPSCHSRHLRQDMLT